MGRVRGGSGRFLRGPVVRGRDGRFTLRLDDNELDVLAHVIGEVNSLDTAQASVAHRLRPPGSHDDDVAREYAELTDSAQTQERQQRRERIIGLLQQTDAGLTADELADLASVVNEIRLVIGTALGITDEGDEPESDNPSSAVYHWLGWFLETLIDALVD